MRWTGTIKLINDPAAAGTEKQFYYSTLWRVAAMIDMERSGRLL